MNQDVIHSEPTLFQEFDIDNIDNKVKKISRDYIQPGGEIIKNANRINKDQVASTASIIARARNSILQFPIYISHSINTTVAQIVAKSFERIYATFVQSVLSQNQYISQDQANNLAFLKQFHTNLKEAADNLVNKYYQPIDDFDQMMQESIFYSAQISENVYVEFRVVPTIDENIIKESARGINDPLTGLIYLKESDDDKDDKPKTQRTTEISREEMILHPKDFKKWAMAQSPDVQSKVSNSNNEIDVDLVKDYMKNHTVRINDDNVKIRPGVRGEDEFYINTSAVATKTIDIPLPPPQKQKLDPMKAPQLLKDGDVKKINGMLPYTIEATFRVVDKDENVDRDVHYVIGIKTVLHLIDPKDLSSELRELITGNLKGLQKVRYKTGEISRNEYLFNTKALKADAMKHITPNKRWLNSLKRVGEYDKLHGSALKGLTKLTTGSDIPIPNGTIILQELDITRLRNETGIDLNVISNARRLADSLALIGIVIVDLTAGTLRVFFPDNDVDWDIQSLASLDAEIAKTDNSALMKEINKRINR